MGFFKDLFGIEEKVEAPKCPKCGESEGYRYEKNSVIYGMNSGGTTKTTVTTDRSARNMTESLFGTGEATKTVSYSAKNWYQFFEIEEGHCAACGYTLLHEIHRGERSSWEEGWIDVNEYLESRPKDCFEKVSDDPQVGDLVYVPYKTESDGSVENCYYPHIITGFYDDGTFNTKTWYAWDGVAASKDTVRFFPDIVKNFPAFHKMRRELDPADEELEVLECGIPVSVPGTKSVYKHGEYVNEPITKTIVGMRLKYKKSGEEITLPFTEVRFGVLSVIEDRPFPISRFILPAVVSIIAGFIVGGLGGWLLKWIPLAGPFMKAVFTFIAVAAAYKICDPAPGEKSSYTKDFKRKAILNKIVPIALIVFMVGRTLPGSFSGLAAQLRPKQVFIYNAGTTATVSYIKVNMMPEPDGRAEPIKILEEGDIVTITNTGPADKDGWISVEHEGDQGYVGVQYIRVINRNE
jgi:hypothetical protein